jgi:hypothetical protein
VLWWVSAEERTVAAWVKCTDSQDRTIFLNLDAAISMVPLERTSLTRIAFIGAVKDTVEVKETPDDLIKAADSARR